jgi:hypothetical protein
MKKEFPWWIRGGFEELVGVMVPLTFQLEKNEKSNFRVCSDDVGPKR